ncbi:MAG: Gfo/Idh/MocA family protein [Alphaproteobacteria bacterium]
MRVKIGLIGCGRQAPKHISGLKAWGEVDIVVADVDPKRARALAASQPVSAVDDVADIFNDPAILAVSICTPPASHVALIRQAVAAGKHFICEKPLSTRLDDAKALEKATTAAGLVGMVGYIYRFAPAFELGAKLLEGAEQSGEAAVLGQISNATFRIGGPGSHDAWQHRRETEGGAINEMLVHMVDLALWYFGPMQSAKMYASHVRQPQRVIAGRTIMADVEDWVLAQMTSQSGVDILIQADLTTPIFLQFAEIHGENGSFMGSIQHDMPNFVHCSQERAGFAAGRTPHTFGPRNLFKAQMGVFMDCIVKGKDLQICTLADTVRLMEAVDMLRNQE